MGRGQSNQATRSAQSLLFGARSIASRPNWDDVDQSEASANLDQGDPLPALELLIKFNQPLQGENDSYQHLAHSVANYLNSYTNRPEQDLFQRLNSDHSILAPSPLVDALSESIANRFAARVMSLDQFTHAEEKFYFERDSQLANQALRDWAIDFPAMALHIGTEPESLTETEAKKLALRQGAYQGLRHNEVSDSDRDLAIDLLAHPQVLEDLNQAQADHLAAEIEERRSDNDRLLNEKREEELTLFDRPITSALWQLIKDR